MDLANKIEELKAAAKLGDGYRFDVKPHRYDPEKWDHVFKTQIPSRREILMARDAVLQDIMLEAKVLGIDVKVNQIEPEPYVSPFDKESA